MNDICMSTNSYLLGNDSFVDSLNAPVAVHFAIRPYDHHVALVRVPHDVSGGCWFDGRVLRW